MKVIVTEKISNARFYSTDAECIANIAAQNGVSYIILDWEEFPKFKESELSNNVEMSEEQDYFKDNKYHDINEEIIKSFSEKKGLWTYEVSSDRPKFFRGLTSIIKDKFGHVLAWCGIQEEALSIFAQNNMLSFEDYRDAYPLLHHQSSLMVHSPIMCSALENILTQVKQGLISDETGRTKALLAINTYAKIALGRD